MSMSRLNLEIPILDENQRSPKTAESQRNHVERILFARNLQGTTRAQRAEERINEVPAIDAPEEAAAEEMVDDPPVPMNLEEMLIRTKITERAVKKMKAALIPYIVKQTRLRHRKSDVIINKRLDEEILIILGTRAFEEFVSFCDYGLDNGWVCDACKEVFHRGTAFAHHILDEHLKLHGTIDQLLTKVTEDWKHGRRHDYMCKFCPIRSDTRLFTNREKILRHIKNDHLLDDHKRLKKEAVQFILDDFGWTPDDN